MRIRKPIACSDGIVKNHDSAIPEKLEVSDRNHAAMIAIQHWL